MNYITYYDSPIGKITLASDGTHLTILKLEKHRFYNDFCFENYILEDDLKIFKESKIWLDEYFANKNPNPNSLSLKPSGSDFRQRVYQILLNIPYGKTMTYGEIAKIINNETGKNMKGQAIGGAVGHNPISIIIPCHRVVGFNNNLVGYGGGIENKIKLLQLEGLDMNSFIIPKKGSAL